MLTIPDSGSGNALLPFWEYAWTDMMRFPSSLIQIDSFGNTANMTRYASAITARVQTKQ